MEKQPSPPNGNDAKIPLLLFTVVFGVFLFFSPNHWLTTPDEEINLRTTLSLLGGQRGAIPPLPGGFATKRGIDGREYAQYGLGLPLLSAPWCQLGLWLDPSEVTARNQLRRIEGIGPAGTPFLRWWMTVFGMLISALTVCLIYAICKKMGISTATAVFASLLLAFGTYLWPHGRTFFTEPLAAFCLAAAVYCLLRLKEVPQKTVWLILAALAWAYAVLVRLDSLVTLPAAMWLVFVQTRENEFRLNFDRKRLFAFAAPFLLVVVVIALYNQYRFDSLFSTGYADQKEGVKFATPVLVGLHGFFFTPGRSLFLFSPPLLFAIPGIFYLWKRHRHFCIGILLLCAGYLGAMAKWQNWAGGWDWGPRHIYQITPFLLLFAAAYLNEIRCWDHAVKRIGMMLLIVLSVFIQFLGLSADAVQVTREWLADPGPVLADVPAQFLMQFQIYLPQFSIPVLHWEWIMIHGADLLLLRSLGTSMWILPAFGLLAVVVGGGFWSLIRRCE
ncbi:phospholipid carrier-dependent glycosyltransferase [bacterium]|nr:phospholipid carrier-dependent glycosyltransferase [bacterium]